MLCRLLLLLFGAGLRLINGQRCIELRRWWPLRLGLFDPSNRFEQARILGRVSFLNFGAPLVPNSYLRRRSTRLVCRIVQTGSVAVLVSRCSMHITCIKLAVSLFFCEAGILASLLSQKAHVVLKEDSDMVQKLFFSELILVKDAHHILKQLLRDRKLVFQ